MTLRPSLYSVRTLSLLLAAAFAALGIWLFIQWRDSGGAVPAPASDPQPASLRIDGDVGADTNGDSITRLVIPLTVRGDGAIALGDDTAGSLRAETELADSAAAAVPAAYSISWLDGNGDRTLDPGEHAVLTAVLPDRSSVRPGQPLRLVLTPRGGEPLAIEDVPTAQ